MIPFNVASYALLLHLICAITGYQPGTLTGFLADVHIYENHLEQVNLQLSREPLALPKLELTGVNSLSKLWEIEPHQIRLVDYQHLGPIPAPMAV